MNITRVQNNNQPNFKAKTYIIPEEAIHIKKYFGTVGDVYDAQKGEAGLEQFKQDLCSQGDDNILHIPLREIGSMSIRSMDLRNCDSPENREMTYVFDLSKVKEAAAKAVEALKAKVGE